MENYSKGENVELPLELGDVPIKNIPSDVTWMQVKPASKMTNLIEFALNSLKEKKVQLWTGIGPAIGKAISCAEIVKRRSKNLHQITAISYHKCEEYWVPKENEDLDTLKVVRQIPAIFILLSVEPLDSAEPGYQAPNSSDNFWKDWKSAPKPNQSKPSNSNKGRFNSKKSKKQPPPPS
uniref:EOG090X0KMN n=1 Tax=Alona affinis TaxID=381656 RepID=A0A9N6WU76_9CRUS|nr:EOG090X0KMN [Alona affinis]